MITTVSSIGPSSLITDPLTDPLLPLDPEDIEASLAATALAGQETSPVFALKELVSHLHREQYKIQDLLSSLGFALRSFKNINQFLDLIPLITSRVTDADGGALLLFRPSGQVRVDRLHCQDRAGDRCQTHTVRRALELAARQVSASLMTAASGEVVSFDEQVVNLLDHRIAEGLGHEVRVFGAPIWVDEVARGRLYAFSCAPEFGWTPKRQKLMRLVADQTAVAIENDELTVKLRQKERLDRELEIGAEIQLQLLPRQSPVLVGADVAARCQPADRVGGDYYDFIPVDRRRFGSISEAVAAGRPHPPLDRRKTSHNTSCQPWGLAIGDVMGKGVPAGLIMTMTRGMLRAEVLNGHTPARILQHLNRVMYADLENSHRFVTLFYSEYDPNTRLLSFSNAAHNPPLLWRAQDDRLEILDADGMLIGLDADSIYTDAQVQLHPGDTVIYYTDGFTDAVNCRGHRFEEDRLRDAFFRACHTCTSAQSILDHLFGEVREFIGPDGHNEDDMTAIILRLSA